MHSNSTYSVLAVLALLVGVAACSGSSTTTTTGTDGGGTTPVADGGTTTGANACGGQVGQAYTGDPIAFCGACTNTYCCTEIQACQNDATCPTLQTCLLRCEATDTLCNQSCTNLYPGGVTTYNNLTNCSSLTCTQACSNPPTGCSQIPLGATAGCSTTQFPRTWSCPGGAPEPQCVDAPSGDANVFCCLQ